MQQGAVSLISLFFPIARHQQLRCPCSVAVSQSIAMQDLKSTLASSSAKSN